MRLKELLLLSIEQKYKGFFIRGNIECGEFKKQWWVNGQLNVHCFYLNGKLNGEYKYYLYNGELREQKLYENGSIIKNYLE